jgi:hypothetical protein
MSSTPPAASPETATQSPDKTTEVKPMPAPDAVARSQAGPDVGPEPGLARVTGDSLLDWTDGFIPRHVGPNEAEVAQMLAELGYDSMESFIGDVVPASIRLDRPLELAEPAGRGPRASTSCSGCCGRSRRRTRSGGAASVRGTTGRSRRV